METTKASCCVLKQQCKSKRSTSYKLSWWYCFQFSAAPLLTSFKRKTYILEEMWELEIFSPFVFCDSGELRKALWFHFRQWIAGLQILTASKTLALFLFLVAEKLPFPFPFFMFYYRNSCKTQVNLQLFLLKKIPNLFSNLRKQFCCHLHHYEEKGREKIALICYIFEILATPAVK